MTLRSLLIAAGVFYGKNRLGYGPFAKAYRSGLTSRIPACPAANSRSLFAAKGVVLLVGPCALLT
jgi:hypothetical protein